MSSRGAWDAYKIRWNWHSSSMQTKSAEILWIYSENLQKLLLFGTADVTMCPNNLIMGIQLNE